MVAVAPDRADSRAGGVCRRARVCRERPPFAQQMIETVTSRPYKRNALAMQGRLCSVGGQNSFTWNSPLHCLKPEFHYLKPEFHCLKFRTASIYTLKYGLEFVMTSQMVCLSAYDELFIHLLFRNGLLSISGILRAACANVRGAL